MSLSILPIVRTRRLSVWALGRLRRWEPLMIHSWRIIQSFVHKTHRLCKAASPPPNSTPTFPPVPNCHLTASASNLLHLLLLQLHIIPIKRRAGHFTSTSLTLLISFLLKRIALQTLPSSCDSRRLSDFCWIRCPYIPPNLGDRPLAHNLLNNSTQYVPSMALILQHQYEQDGECKSLGLD